MKNAKEKNWECLYQCDKIGIRIDGIIHLASVLGLDELEEKFHMLIDYFVDHLFSGSNHHKSILPLIPKEKEEGESIFRMCLHNYWLRKEFFGFVILATAINYGTVKSHSEIYLQQWFYGADYYEAFDLILDWVRKEHT